MKMNFTGSDSIGSSLTIDASANSIDIGFSEREFLSPLFVDCLSFKVKRIESIFSETI